MKPLRDFMNFISIPLRYNLESLANLFKGSTQGNFNSTKVQFGACTCAQITLLNPYFNSTKVQFGELPNGQYESLRPISIPLRYNLEP